MKRKQKSKFQNFRIAFGGGCHWCTEAVFQSLRGVEKVDQGCVASSVPNEALSEAVIVHFTPNLISLSNLIEVHLHTHQCTTSHALRHKYRSAVYAFDEEQAREAERLLTGF